jgi:hypothetical protein
VLSIVLLAAVAMAAEVVINVPSGEREEREGVESSESLTKSDESQGWSVSNVVLKPYDFVNVPKKSARPVAANPFICKVW